MGRTPVVALLVAVCLLAGVAGGALVALIGEEDGSGGTTTTVVASGDRAGGGGQPTAERVYNESKDAVAFITAQVSGQQSSPFGPTGGQGTATGSGFVATGDGAIVTNAHVVEGASSVTVKIGDQSARGATVVGSDPSTDVALLRVRSGSVDTRPLPFANSGDLVVGEPVYAIGNPFGLDRTLTTGVVSALQRQIAAPNGFAITGVVQTDAPINPGNSGGPLLDASGKVIGVNSQILTGGSGSQGSVGIGFAVPSNTVRNVIGQLEANGRVQHAYLGVQTTVPSSGSGAQVASVAAGGPAAAAGVRAGDVVVRFGRRAIDDPAALSAAVNAKAPGDSVTLTLRRGGGERTVTVTLGTQPASASTP